MARSPRQEIRPHVPLAPPREDLRVFPEEARKMELTVGSRRNCGAPFIPADRRSSDGAFTSSREQKYSLLHTEHHFVHDGWSYGVFLEELYATYRRPAERANLFEPNPEPLQFAEFALWQREMITSGAWDHQLDYWRKELSGCPPPPSLPSDRRLGHRRSFEGSQIRHPISEALWNDLGKACAREGVTRFAWIQAVFHLFIHLQTGAQDFCHRNRIRKSTRPAIPRDAGNGDQYAPDPCAIRRDRDVSRPSAEDSGHSSLRA